MVGDLTVDSVTFSREEIEAIVRAVNIQELFTQTNTPLVQLSDEQLASWVVEYGGLVDPVGQFQAWIAGVISDFAAWITGNVTSAIKTFTETIINAFNAAVKPIQETLSKVVLPSITSFVSTVVDFFTKTFPQLISQLQQGVQSAFKSVLDSVTVLQKQLGDLAGNLARTFASLADTLSKAVEDAVSRIQSQLSTALSSLMDAIRGGASQLSNVFSQALRTLQDVFSRIQSQLSDLVARIQSMVSQIPAAVQNMLGQLQSWIGGVGKAIDSVFGLLRDVPGLIMKSVSDVTAWIWERLPDWVKTFLTEAPRALAQVGVTIQGFVNSILRFPDWFPTWFYENIAKPIVDAMQSLAGWIWERLPQPVRGFFDTAGKFFDMLVKMPSEFWSFITKTVPEFFTKTLPEWGVKVRDFFTRVSEAIKPVLERVMSWLKKPSEFWKDIGSFMTNALDTLVKWLHGQFNVLANAVQGFASAVTGWLGQAGGAIADALGAIPGMAMGALKYVAGWFKSISVDVVKTVHSVISSVLTTLLEPLRSMMGGMKDTIAKMMRGELGELETIVAMFISFVPVALFINLASLPFGVLAHWGRSLREALESAVKSIPFAGRAMAGIVHATLAPINRALLLMSKEIRKASTQFPNWLGLGLALAWSDALKYVSAWLWKRFYRQTVGWDLTFRLPDYGELTSVMQRVLPQLHNYDVVVPEISVWVPGPPPRQEKVKMDARYWLERLWNYFDMYGYPDSITKLFTAMADEFYITLTDRFGAERKVPLGPLYELPPFGDLAEMMVRDLFASVDDFAKVSVARGMYPDIAKLYYIYHFKYPPLEKIWEFYNRAQANVLWFTPAPSDVERAKREALSILPPDVASNYVPVPPAQLNVMGRSDVASKLLDAVATYVKWYDYATWSWIKGFTSDKWLITDLLADLPTRIDTRWMYKWMVPDYVAEVAGFPKLSPQITYGEQLMGQIVIARAMNPRFVPMVAIAEMMNALTEERTLFRTGIINAFRRGFTTLENMWNALNGLFTLDFWAPFWNADKLVYEWRKVTVPVRFLEGEAKLLLMRALYDRADIYFRDFRRQFIAMITDNYDSPQNLPRFLAKIVDDLNKQLVQFAKSIGAEKAFTLQYDDSMAAFDKAYAELRNAHRTLTRGRGWMRSVLYRLWARFQSGYISEDEMRKYIDDIVREFKLTEQERDFFLETAKLFRELHRRQTLAKNVLRKLKQGLITEAEAVDQLVKLGFDRETAQAEVESELKVYTPSISQLATLVELVPEAIQLFDRVCRRMGVSEEEKNFWLLCVQRRTVKDEVSRLVTEVITDYARGILTDDDWKKIMQELKNFGYTEQEIQLLTMIARLRKTRLTKK